MGDDAPGEERFNRLWHEHAAAVLAYARRRVDEAQADEVVAETFVVAWRRLAEVPVAARPWLFGVARRVSANQRRSERRWDALARPARRGTAGRGFGSPAAGLAGLALGRLPPDRSTCGARSMRRRRVGVGADDDVVVRTFLIRV
ncbi:sigma factor [Actinoplanes aureus]|uniref:RNA polymerase sigma-70 region 2 domain-containing protein n=1 Tax=Actinoplanes aureus TaxID=2792083 RepID=A0A931CC54_9ACTN|nr:sigma factor [Actinoplanes aureus]MBG0567354.1 hypothetical protein [Actinoplanes aureus]